MQVRFYRRRGVNLPTFGFVVILLLVLGLGAAGGYFWASRPIAPAPELEPEDPWERAKIEGVDFRGVGQKPDWVVEVQSGKTVQFISDYGRTGVMASLVEDVIIPLPGTTVFRADVTAFELTITVEDRPCIHSATGEQLPNTVTVRLNGHEYRGCGKFLQ